MDEYLYPVTVHGAQSKSFKNKLQLYFQSKKKSSGGECRVQVADDGTATVYFKSQEVRERVLAREHHEVHLDTGSVKLHLCCPSIPPKSDDVSDFPKDSDSSDPKSEPGNEGVDKEDETKQKPQKLESVQSFAVVLDNVSESMSRDLLSMLVENIALLDENSYSLEIIWEAARAVVTFNNPRDGESFFTASQNSTKLQRHGLTARLLEEAQSVRVESLPRTVVKEMLELYFEKSWLLPVDIVMIPEERAAIVTFDDPKVVGSISKKKYLVMCTTAVKVYPYYKSLGTALYGKERPTWKMPEPFTESVHHIIWKFLLMKKHLKTINEQMSRYFCSVDLDRPEVKLSPLPSLLRQKGLTATHVDEWMGNSQKAFRQLLAQYTAFECSANAPTWKVAEKEVRSVVKEDAILVLDASRGCLTVAGGAEDIKRIKASVESIVLRTMSKIERQRYGVSEVMDVSPSMFYILQQGGLQQAVLDISPEMLLSYQDDTKKLTILGLEAEVYKAKSWILERNMRMSKRLLDVNPHLLHFLKSVDSMEMSQDLFTSQGISAIYSLEGTGVVLTGSSESILSDAESRVKKVLSLQMLDVEDQEVLRMPKWMKLNQQLSDTYNSSKKRTVVIQTHPERGDKITVAGFLNPVKEVSHSLKDFIVNYSQVKETIRVKSCAVVQFIQEKKTQDLSSIIKADEVTVNFESRRPRINLSGARLHVQKAKASFQNLAAALCTDNFTVDKPGAKKYFLSQGSGFLATVMKEINCVVVLRPENEEEEDYEDEDGQGISSSCKVQTANGVLVSVSMVDICSFNVDAVVNAANEELQHVGGVALALLKAAGPQLQKISNDYIANNGRLRPGDAIITDSYNLPCKYVVHTVGPRFTDSDKKTAVSRLKLAIKESLRQAATANCSTIALPAISSGVFGFPLELCAETIAKAVREYCENEGGLGSLTEIHLVDNNSTTVRSLAQAVNREFIDLGPKMTLSQQVDGRGMGTGGEVRGGVVDIRAKEEEHGEQEGHGEEEEEHGEQEEDEGHGEQEGHGEEEEEELVGEELDIEEVFRETGKFERMEQERILATPEGLKIVLRVGNIQDQSTDVIINTISENLNLNQGAVSKAILEAAGPGLQSDIKAEARAATVSFGDVIITDGFNLRCQKVFHAVCPFWDNGSGQADEELRTIIGYCLEEADKLQMASLSFPAIGTGNMSFPRALVSRLLLKEIHAYSRRRTSQHLREVAVVVHTSDSQTVDCFTREFKGQAQGNVQQEASDFERPPPPPRQSPSQSQQSSASFGKVSSPSLGVYQMQMGHLTLEVSSGDITKETSDVIVNSSNKDFNLKSGVSKAILDGAGLTVEQECSQIVNAPGYQQVEMLLTSPGQLPCQNIIHIVGRNDPANIKDVVYSVLKTCEAKKFASVAFPALGTGQGGVSPAAVADAMIDAVVDFVRKKHQRFVRSVKILIFQTVMVPEFHKSMKRREGEEVEEKSVFTKIKDSFTSFFSGASEERPRGEGLVLEGEEFEPAMFQLCAEDAKAVSQAKKRIEELIVAEQAERKITDHYISELSQADAEELKALQRELTVSIRLEKKQGDQEPYIHLEGLTRDVFTAESTIRDLIQKVERTDNQKQKAILLSGLVEWQYPSHNGAPVAFDVLTNCILEEALEKKRSVKIKINNEDYTADAMLRKAVRGKKEVELLRKDLKDDATPLPADWEDMKGSLTKRVPLIQGSPEYNSVQQKLQRTGLTPNIISIERIQNKTLWQSYQLMKKQLEEKNKHTNNERQLFHGTSSNPIDLINTQGFNRSYAGAHAAMYGLGTYFAVDPIYSARGYAKPDALGHKRMYLARVLVGDFTQGAAAMITPPSKGSAADLYDSVTDKTSNPTMFIIFNDIQAYPEYLITFT
ncbi:protein mono-ADP-ribosyltransferase PARP14-like [Diretmus argenteus]